MTIFNKISLIDRNLSLACFTRTQTHAQFGYACVHAQQDKTSLSEIASDLENKIPLNHSLTALKQIKTIKAFLQVKEKVILKLHWPNIFLYRNFMTY
jgi:hypothetical protein